MARFHDHRRPRVLKFDFAFGLMKGEQRIRALDANGIHPQHGNLPNLVHDHLQTRRLHHARQSRTGNDRRLSRFIPAYQPGETVSIRLAGPNGFGTVHPKLAEFQSSTIDSGNIRHPHLAGQLRNSRYRTRRFPPRISIPPLKTGVSPSTAAKITRLVRSPESSGFKTNGVVIG